MPARRRPHRPPLIAALLIASWPIAALGADLIDREDLARFDLQRFWQTETQAGGDLLDRIVAVDDNLYLISSGNRAFALHTGTGIIRWSAEIAGEGQTVRGPTHSPQYAVFTTSTAVRLLHRRTGLAAQEPRALHGVVIEVRGDIADINIGRLHGVQPGDVLNVTPRGAGGFGSALRPARFQAVTVHERETTGRFLEFDQGNRPQPGNEVWANVALPLPEVKVPFPPSAAAVADDQHIYVAAANQRLYSLTIIGGYRQWQIMTPRTATATPRLLGRLLVVAAQNGEVIATDVLAQGELWRFRTEAPVFADPVVTPQAVFAASSDRSLYAIDLAAGTRLWRTRFDAELLHAPIVHDMRVYQFVPGNGLVVLDAKSGDARWSVEDGLSLLTQIGDDVFISCGAEGPPGAPPTLTAVGRFDAKSGAERGRIELRGIAFVAGQTDPPAIFAADRLGRAMCARPARDARLTAAELADVMRNDAAKAVADEVQAKLDAERASRQRAAKPSAPAADPFASRSTAPPAVGTGIVPPGEAGAEPGAPRDTATRAAEEPAKSGDEEASGESESEEPAEDAAGEEPEESSGGDSPGDGG